LNQNNQPNPPNHFLFTVDVEDWFQVENFKTSIPFESWERRELRVERNTHRLLDLLDEVGPVSRGQGFEGSCETNQFNQRTNSTNVTNKQKIRATFFVLGWIARKLPDLIREIHERGHEVASHGNNHHLCTVESAESLQKDLTDSKALLEDIIGSRVRGYRAPSFSVTSDIVKIIQDAGYQYDSSYNSFDKHGRYGKLNTNGFRKVGIAYQLSDHFYEIPISNLSLKPIACSLQPIILPFGGGGYFRLFPYLVFKKAIREILRTDRAYSFYMHPWEVDPNQPRVQNAPRLLKFRHYVNLASTEQKIRRMLFDFRDCRFVTCREYVAQL
jgi:polysaccharide deacetylase family protein (PEP-CTERM system associated)